MQRRLQETLLILFSDVSRCFALLRIDTRQVTGKSRLLGSLAELSKGNAMKTTLLMFCLLSAVWVCVAAHASPSVKRRAWITIGDAAYRQIASISPTIVSIESRELGVAGSSERVHAVAMYEGQLAQVAEAIHRRMGQCGGFMYHATEAEARAALESPRLVSPGRSYAINNRDLLEPLLAKMQEKISSRRFSRSALSSTGITPALPASTLQNGCSPNGAN